LAVTFPSPNQIQFTCHTELEGGRVARFVVKRKKLERFARAADEIITGFLHEQRLSGHEASAAAMRSVRWMLDPETAQPPATPLGDAIKGWIGDAIKHMGTLPNPDEKKEFEALSDRLNQSALGSTVAKLTVWYCLFRHDTGYFRIRPKQWRSIHVYYLPGDHPTAPAWPLIKISHGPYENWEKDHQPEIELPDLDRIDVWRR
jgi:hypothetical protein